MILKPIHRKLFSILEELVEDGTFNQGKVITRLQEIKRGSDAYSYDLSSATDRLPIAVQEQVLGYFLTDNIASKWRNLISSIE